MAEMKGALFKSVFAKSILVLFVLSYQWPRAVQSDHFSVLVEKNKRERDTPAQIPGTRTEMCIIAWVQDTAYQNAC